MLTGATDSPTTLLSSAIGMHARNVLRLVNSSFPLLHHRPATLETTHITQHQRSVIELLAWECGHKSIRSLRRGWRGGVYEAVDIANGVGGIEARS